MNEAMGDSSDSPTLANAPLVLQQSLIFPYVAGLNFVRAVWTAKGRNAAFAEMLDHPPSSTYEIMNPAIYLTHAPVPLLKMPDIHSLIDAEYRPYDIGVMGEFDVQLMAEFSVGKRRQMPWLPRGVGEFITPRNPRTPPARAQKTRLGRWRFSICRDGLRRRPRLHLRICTRRRFHGNMTTPFLRRRTIAMLRREQLLLESGKLQRVRCWWWFQARQYLSARVFQWTWRASLNL